MSIDCHCILYHFLQPYGCPVYWNSKSQLPLMYLRIWPTIRDTYFSAEIPPTTFSCISFVLRMQLMCPNTGSLEKLPTSHHSYCNRALTFVFLTFCSHHTRNISQRRDILSPDLPHHGAHHILQQFWAPLIHLLIQQKLFSTSNAMVRLQVWLCTRD